MNKQKPPTEHSGRDFRCGLLMRTDDKMCSSVDTTQRGGLPPRPKQISMPHNKLRDEPAPIAMGQDYNRIQYNIGNSNNTKGVLKGPRLLLHRHKINICSNTTVTIIFTIYFVIVIEYLMGMLLNLTILKMIQARIKDVAFVFTLYELISFLQKSTTPNYHLSKWHLGREYSTLSMFFRSMVNRILEDRVFPVPNVARVMNSGKPYPSPTK